MNLSELQATAAQKVLIIGLPGSGKTTLASKLAEHYHIHVLSIENSSGTFLKLPQEWWPNVTIYNIPDSANFPVAAQTLMSLFKKRTGTICRKHGAWECSFCKQKQLPIDPISLDSLDTSKDVLILDTGTQLGNSILAHLTKDKPVDYKPERDDWGALRKFTEFFASEFQAATFNLVVICHLAETKLEDGKTMLGPDFGSAKMAAGFGAKFDHVIYCDIRNKKHVAGSSSTYAGNIVTKSRTDFRIEDLPVPSLVPIFKQAPLKQPDNGDKAVEQLKVATAPSPSSLSTSSTTTTEIPAKPSLANLTKLLNKDKR